MRNRLPFAVVSWNPPSYLFSYTLFYDHAYYLIVDTNTSVKITSTDKHRHSREAQTPKPRWHLVCLCSRSELLTEVLVILSINIRLSNIPTTSIMIMTVLTLFKFTLFIEVGSNTVVTGGDGAKYRGREYPWGTGRSPLFIFLNRSVGTWTIPCSEHRGQQPLRLHGSEKPRAGSPHAGPQRGKSPLYSSKPPTILHLTQKTKIVAPSKLPPGDSLCPLRELPVHEAAADDEQSANCKTFDHQCKTGDISHQKC